VQLAAVDRHAQGMGDQLLGRELVVHRDRSDRCGLNGLNRSNGCARARRNLSVEHAAEREYNDGCTDGHAFRVMPHRESLLVNLPQEFGPTPVDCGLVGWVPRKFAGASRRADANGTDVHDLMIFDNAATIRESGSSHN
jgi:hypothetical protein